VNFWAFLEQDFQLWFPSCDPEKSIRTLEVEYRTSDNEKPRCCCVWHSWDGFITV